MAGTVIDVLNADVALLRSKLDSGELQSVDLVTAYLKQIKKHNADGVGLKALISVAPEESVLSQARHVHEERKTKGTRGPFHGIPVILKVSFFLFLCQDLRFASSLCRVLTNM